MAIINRLSSLFKADFHAVLDRLEDPASLLRQSIREMQECIDLAEHQSGILEEKINSTSKRLHTLTGSNSKNEQELDLCFETGEEDLARKLIKRKLEQQQITNYLKTRISEQKAEWSCQCKELESNRNRLAALKQKAELFTQPHNNTIKNHVTEDEQWVAEVTQEDIEIAYLAEKHQRATS